MNKGKNTAKGITLIALVITIIVMLILVGVTISMALNGGLFGYAKKAARDTESQKQAEQELASGAVTIDGVKYDSMQDYMNGFPSGTPKAKPIDEVEKTEKGILKENGAYASDGKTAIIPKGFKIIADEIGEKSIAKGLIITDEVDSTGKSTGNEYVWVPVEDGTLDRTDWKNNGMISQYTDVLPEDLANSVEINKGFYIGRYEAGSEEVRSNSTKDTLTEVFTKEGLYVYNYVSYDNAVSKIGELYTDKTKYGAGAIMPCGAMWDETLNFVNDSSHNVTDSTNWGNYLDATFEFTGEYCENPEEEVPIYTRGTNAEKPADKRYLLTTGASEKNKAKNIYDLAGNVDEWTGELSIGSFTVQNFRGGDCGFYGQKGVNKASDRQGLGYENYSSVFIGFRPALYIK